jgi:YHS domain-containing protein
MTLHPPRARRIAPGVSLLVALGCAGLCEPQVPGSEPEPIAWRDDYGSALEEARAAKRLLWVQFTGPWCPNCTRMERDSFPHPAIIEHARASFVPVKLRSDVHEALALHFNLSGLPATIIVAPNRDIIAVQQGYLGPDEFDAFLRDSLARRPDKPATTGPADTAVKPPKRDKRAQNHQERLALAGYCVVSLVNERKLVEGKSDYSVRHEGRVYRFASLELVDRFKKSPERYVPANDGACPVEEIDRAHEHPGDPRWGILYRGHLFLFASEDNRRRFVKEPDRYSIVDVVEKGFCVHCIRETGLLVRGDPRHEITLEGQRYWFPDPGHREAFLALGR